MVDKNEAVDRSAVTELGAALERLVSEDKVDDSAIGEINAVVENLNEKTKAAILDLPVIQKIIEQRAATENGTVEPGSIVQMGMFSRKVPYSKAQVYQKWGVAASYVAPETITVVTPGGWHFRLREGVIYDMPLSTPAEKMPEDHGYQLPNIVLGIMADRATAFRVLRRETELHEFGQGVKFLQTGWAGKDQEIAVSAAAAHPTPTTE